MGHKQEYNKLWKRSDKGKIAQARSNRTPNGRYRSLKFAAKNKGLGFDISKDEYSKLLLESCAYCKGPLPTTGSGLDRVDNTQGYLASNVVPCCGDCNRIKCHLLTHQEMKVAMEAILKLRGTT